MSNSNNSTNGSLNDSMKGNPVLSPKVGTKEEETARQYLMKKRSPTKVMESGETTGVNTSVNYQPASMKG